MAMIGNFVRGATLALLAGMPAFAEDPTAATVVATVNGTDITLGHLIAARETLPDQYQQLPDEVLFKGLLDQMIQQVALSQVAEKDLSVRAQLDLDNQRRSYLSSSILDAAGASAVTDEAVQKLYDETIANAEAVKEYSAQHILVETEDEAKQIIADIKAGGDFAAIAKEKSKDPGSGAQGGDLGWFQPAMMVEPFAKAVEALEKGAMTEAPVETQFGWHIIKLNDVREAAKPTLDEKREELKVELQNRAIDAKIKEITDTAEVTRTEGIDPAILKKSELID